MREQLDLRMLYRYILAFILAKICGDKKKMDRQSLMDSASDLDKEYTYILFEVSLYLSFCYIHSHNVTIPFLYISYDKSWESML